MKSKLHPPKKPPVGCWLSLLATCGALSSLIAAEPPAAKPDEAVKTSEGQKPDQPAKAEDTPAAEETTKPAEPPATPSPEELFEGPSKNNWIEFSTGGFLRSGNKSQFQERHRSWDGPFGGIEDFHYQRDLGKETILTTDGRALFDIHNYKFQLGLSREKLGYLRFSYDEFRTWYNGDGGFYPPSDLFFPLSDDALALDRGSISFEGGLTLEGKPQVHFKYENRYREGTKSSTVWGITHPGNVTRALSPSFYDIDERSHAFQIDATHKISKTDLGVGLRYETGELDNALKITESPGEPLQRKITDRHETNFDLFNTHAFTETWINEKVMFSSGFSFSDLDNDFSGSRIYGSDFDVNYIPNALDGAGYIAFNGGSRLQEYVMNLNLLTIPLDHFTIVPSLRVQKEDIDADFGALQTLGANIATPINGNSERDLLDVRERLDLRYSGVTNWVFFARGEWTEGEGNLKEFGGTIPIGGVGIPPVQRETEDTRFFQKYSLGARWHPLQRLTLDGGGYYKINEYNYDHLFDSTPNTSANRYPAYLVMQDFETYDAHVGSTFRPWQNVTLGSRYEFQISNINTKPASISGLGEVESSEMTSHIMSQNISWSPWSRLYLQGNVSYVISETETPASKFTQAILDSQNNYWNFTFSSGLVLNDKTDLKLAYNYYLADNYEDNSDVGVPLGAGAEQHGVTATLLRRITENLRLKLKYGYFQFNDETFGGHRSFEAHGLFSSLQYRF